MFRLYVGSNNETGKLERKKIEKIVSGYFEGFTAYRAMGYWRGQKERTLIVEIETKETDKVKNLITELKKELKQQAIGLVKAPKMIFI